jgi:hypothetical protein
MNCLAIVFATIAMQLSAAQLLSAYDQAYGQWMIKLSRNVFSQKWHLETVDGRKIGNIVRKRNKQDANKSNNIKQSALQIIFPTIIKQDNDTDVTIADGEQANNAQTIEKMTHKPVRSINCLLNLQRNGKFTIHLDDNRLDTVDRNPACTNCNNNYQPMHGEWFLTPNPYCVTDRHYDEITLVSEPRIRRVYLPTSTVVEKATVELRCKLWGRYSAGAVRKKIGLKHGRMMARMTHGTILIVKETFNDVGGGSLGDATKLLPQRDIVGTFCGRAIVFNRDVRSDSGELSTEENYFDESILFDDDHDASNF